MIYFFERADGRIKIGHTSKPTAESRRRDLKTGAGELVILGSIAGNRATETALHQRFALERADGEWFAITRETVADLIASHHARSFVGRLQLRGKVWQMVYVVDGRKVVESTGETSKRAARDVLGQRLQQINTKAWSRTVPKPAGAAAVAASEREQWNRERLAFEATIAEMRYRPSARAQLEGAPAASIPAVLGYVVERTSRSDVDPDQLQERARVWSAAAKAAAAELERMQEEKTGFDSRRLHPENRSGTGTRDPACDPDRELIYEVIRRVRRGDCARHSDDAIIAAALAKLGRQ